MAKFECDRCGAVIEGKCKPQTCPQCSSGTMKKVGPCGCGCKR